MLIIVNAAGFTQVWSTSQAIKLSSRRRTILWFRFWIIDKKTPLVRLLNLMLLSF